MRDPLRQEMVRIGPLAGVEGSGVYRATVAAARPAGDYTVRLIPRCDGLAVPLEAHQILWQR
jgi:starch phosphorylase